MPSFWDLLCVGRQKYTTDDKSSQRRPHTVRCLDDPSYCDPADVEYYIQPEFHFHREPFARDAVPWCVNTAHSSKSNSQTEFVLQSKKEKEKRDSYAYPLLSEKPSSRASSHKSEKKQNRPGQQPHAAANHGPRKEAESEKKPVASNVGKRRRHVKDIFRDNGQYHDTRYRPLSNTSASSIASSSRSHQSRRYQKITARSQENSQRSQSGSMHQYSPRTVSDHAVSGALFGNRLDDFVNDPGWNRAIDKFAASPSSTSSFHFSERSFPSSERSHLNPRRRQSNNISGAFVQNPGWNRAASPTPSSSFFFGEKTFPSGEHGLRRGPPRNVPGNVAYAIPAPRIPHSSYQKRHEKKRGRHSEVIVQPGPPRTSSDFYYDDKDRQPGHGAFDLKLKHLDYEPVTRAPSRGSNVAESHNSADIEKLFSANGDVLY